jgi:hypothetical protein
MTYNKLPPATQPTAEAQSHDAGLPPAMRVLGVGWGADFQPKTITIRRIDEVEAEKNMLIQMEKNLLRVVRDNRMAWWLQGEYRWLLRRVQEKLYGTSYTELRGRI